MIYLIFVMVVIFFIYQGL